MDLTNKDISEIEEKPKKTKNKK